MSLPAHLEALREEALRTSCISWAIGKRWALARIGVDRAGPCPVCGGTDRFAIHTGKDTYNCRRCGIAGHGVIDLVMQTESVDFTRACEIITGRSASEPVDEARAERMRKANEADAARREADEARYREKARKAAYAVWNRATAIRLDGPVDRYLALRGIDIRPIAAASRFIMLREIEAHPWTEQLADKSWFTLHKGPAMIAAVLRADGTFGAVHQTWLDAAQPNGKLELPPTADGRERPSKKVLGAKKGGAIRLFTPHPQGDARRIVMGEGIETTLTAMAHNFEEATAYWAGVDLGNMAGRDARDAEGGHLWDQPDLDDRDCFLPPDWTQELVYLCDGDEARNHTEEKVIRGLRRAAALRELMRQQNGSLTTLETSYVPPLGPGLDLNDLVRVG